MRVNGFIINSSLGRLFEKITYGTSGFHSMNGIFIANGKYLNIKITIDARIYDIFPTILHIFNISIPNDIDGKVLTQIFNKESQIAKENPIYIDPVYYARAKKLIKII